MLYCWLNRFTKILILFWSTTKKCFHTLLRVTDWTRDRDTEKQGRLIGLEQISASCTCSSLTLGTARPGRGLSGNKRMRKSRNMRIRDMRRKNYKQKGKRCDRRRKTTSRMRRNACNLEVDVHLQVQVPHIALVGLQPDHSIQLLTLNINKIDRS